MTTAERTLKWWNDYVATNKTYPLIAEVEAQLNMAVDEEKRITDLSIDEAYENIESVFRSQVNEYIDSYKYYEKDKEEVIAILKGLKNNKT